MELYSPKEREGYHTQNILILLAWYWGVWSRYGTSSLCLQLDLQYKAVSTLVAKGTATADAAAAARNMGTVFFFIVANLQWATLALRQCGVVATAMLRKLLCKSISGKQRQYKSKTKAKATATQKQSKSKGKTRTKQWQSNSKVRAERRHN